MNDFQKFQLIFAERSAHYYMRIAKALLRLEIPIELPMELISVPDASEAMEHALDLVRELPMSRVQTAAYTTVIVEWLSGMLLAEHGTEDVVWPIIAGVVSTERLGRAMELLEGLLDGDIEISEYDEE